MSLRRIGVLLTKDLVQGPKNFIFVFALVGPILISLVLSLVFGSFFWDKPKLGIFDEGSSQIIQLALDDGSIDARTYASEGALQDAVRSGAVDMGVVLAPGIDQLIASGQKADIQAYVWGESLAQDRVLLSSTIADLAREVAGQPSEIATVEIVPHSLREPDGLSWQDRLLPLVVLMAAVFGGAMVPATSLVDEKQKRTLNALVVTPTRLWEVFLSKAMVGILLSIVAGLLILALNRAFGSRPDALVPLLAMGAMLAAAFGVLMGAAIRDITTLFAIFKGIGILLYAPALIYMFPQIPQWIGRIFPTYYIYGPIMKVTQESAGWGDIATEVIILAAMIIALALAATFVAQRGESGTS